MGGGGIPRARSHPDRLRGESDRVRDERQDASTDKERAQFLAVVSHEMRTPLTSIISFSELLRGEAGGLSPEGMRFLGIIERNADRLLRLIDDLLMLNRLEAGGLPLELTQVSLPDLAAEAVKTATPVAAKSGVTVHLDAGHGPAGARRPQAAHPGTRQPDRQRGQVLPRGRAGAGPAALPARHLADRRLRHGDRHPGQ